jgi:hypothetical protein
MLNGLAEAMGPEYGENPPRLIVKILKAILIISYVIACCFDPASAYNASHLTHIQMPDNLFESSFIIALVSPFLKACKGSPHKYGRPTGAFALAAAGVSRFPC